jgi:hypothetical protein
MQSADPQNTDDDKKKTQQAEDPQNTEEPSAQDPTTEELTSDQLNQKKNGGGPGVEGPKFDDQKAESGSIEKETDISIKGDNNNQCTGLLQFDQSGNFLNQQGTTQTDIGEFEQEFAGPKNAFTPKNGTECEQGVEQASTASSS